MADLLPGTLELLILTTLHGGPMHGYGIVQRIRNVTDAELVVEEGSLYPALQRLLRKGWVTAAWGVTGLQRRARFYTLTARGRRQLGHQRDAYRRTHVAVERVLNGHG